LVATFDPIKGKEIDASTQKQIVKSFGLQNISFATFSKLLELFLW
jgi:hypothetical protein